MKTKIVIGLMVMTMLSACGGSGGGGSDSSPSDGGGYTPPGGGGGSTGGGNGNANYYAIQTYPSNAPIEDVSAPGSAIVIPNEFYIDIIDATQAQFEFGVYQPTCLNGASYNDYALVLVEGGSNTSISARVTSSGINIQTNAIDQNIPDKKKIGSLTSYSGTCTNGKMTLSGGGYVFSNGKSIVFRVPTTNYLYIGFSTTKLLNAVSNTANQITFDDGMANATAFDYLYNDYTDMVNGVANTSANTAGDSVRVFNGTVKIGSNLTTTMIPNGSVDVTAAHTVLSGASRHYETIIADFSGRKVVFAADSGGGVACTNQGGNYSTCDGLSRLFLAVEQ